MISQLSKIIQKPVYEGITVFLYEKNFKYWIDIKNIDAQSFNFFTNDIYKSIQTC